MAILLTRDEFRAKVFERDNGRCVVCGDIATDAHHIMERKLFPDGGYYLENGASLCERHHLEAEQTVLSVEAIRQLCKITETVLPPSLEASASYDKWGNPIFPNGRRWKGGLFDDPGTQKVLGQAGMLSLFDDRIKYPRTFHLPWSDGIGSDDKVLEDLSALQAEQVVATLKMDGENTTMYGDFLHARSASCLRPHPSRTWVKAFHSRISHDIPAKWRICGENLWGRHSIGYDNLESYFLGFSVWDDKNRCLSWDETLEWLGLLGIVPVREIYRGPFDGQAIRDAYAPFASEHEGYVVRVAGPFEYSEFRRKVAKYVRANHVQTGDHWLHGEVKRNRLAPR